MSRVFLKGTGGQPSDGADSAITGIAEALAFDLRFGEPLTVLPLAANSGH
jgi:hypothetical protein